MTTIEQMKKMKEMIDRLEQENAQLRLQIDMLKMEKENDGWIPCSRKMPEENENKAILINEEYGNVEVAYYYGKGEYVDTYANGYCHKIIAWRPLPEPYKGDTDATRRVLQGQ